jgi:hypothetical protein
LIHVLVSVGIVVGLTIALSREPREIAFSISIEPSARGSSAAAW